MRAVHNLSKSIQNPNNGIGLFLNYRRSQLGTRQLLTSKSNGSLHLRLHSFGHPIRPHSFRNKIIRYCNPMLVTLHSPGWSLKHTRNLSSGANNSTLHSSSKWATRLWSTIILGIISHNSTSGTDTRPKSVSLSQMTLHPCTRALNFNHFIGMHIPHTSITHIDQITIRWFHTQHRNRTLPVLTKFTTGLII